MNSIVAGLLAWLVPGAGHWFIGRRVRAVILFVTIQGLFWWGVAIGGVFTVDPREELWWSRAQLCTGAGGMVSYYRQSVKHQSLVGEAYGLRATGDDLDESTQSLKAAKGLVLVAPAAGPARVFTGVAGMLNLLCIIDVVLLAALGLRGEPVRGSPTVSEEAA